MVAADDTVVIYKYGHPSPALAPDISPFVIKLETWLRMSGIPYQTRTGTRREMPYNKLPVARIDGELVPDSALIIRRLLQRYPHAVSDQQLSPHERAQACALSALLEERLYFIGVYFRYCVQSNFDAYKPLLLDYGRRSAPRWQQPLVPLLGPLILPFVQSKLRKQAWQQGTARHTIEDINAMGIEAWQAVRDTLGASTFLFGEQPSIVDATAFAMLQAELRFPFASRMHEHVLAEPALVAYHDRIWDRYWRPQPDQAEALMA